MKKIDAVWICVVKEDEKDEGIPAIRLGDMYYPLLTANEGLLASIKKEAQTVANENNAEVRVLKFTNAELIETIKPEIDDGNN